MDTPQPLQDNELALTLDGEDVEPDTVATVATLALAAAYFHLLEKVASVKRVQLQLSGVRVVNKCMQLRTTDNSGTGYARYAAAEVRRILHTRGQRPHGVRGAVGQVEQCLRHLGPEVTVSLVGSDWEVPIRRAEEPGPVVTAETIEGRAYVVRAGGRTPYVTLDMDTETTSFNLTAPEALAKEIGQHLYDWVDVEATLRRDQLGRVVGGELHHFEPVPDGDGLEAWRAWYRSSMSHWDDVEDIEAALERG